MQPSDEPERRFSQEDPAEVIRSLTRSSVISTTSSFATEYQQAVQNDDLQLFRHIGAGSCGTVFEQIGTTHVIKYSTSSSSLLAANSQLWNDLIMHKTVSEAFERVTFAGFDCQIRVPRCYQYVSSNDVTWWNANIDRFPATYRHRVNVLISERILPVPRRLRDALINLYCPHGLRDIAKRQGGNRDCLIRLYLGKRRDRMPERQKPLSMFSLRNFNLCLDQMQNLQLDVEYYARRMAEALAIMHWEARIDAADVEFVLGSAPCVPHIGSLPTSAELENLPENVSTHPDVDFTRRTLHVWLLDFNQCHKISMDEAGVDQAVTRFFVNDPYYPRPHSKINDDETLWQTFKKHYLIVSNHIVDADYEHLPLQFIQKVNDQWLARLEKMKEAKVRSEIMGLEHPEGI